MGSLEARPRFLLSIRRDRREQELAGTPRTHARGTHDSSFSALAIYGWRATWQDARRHGVIKVPLSMGNCNPRSLQPLQLLCHVVFSIARLFSFYPETVTDYDPSSNPRRTYIHTYIYVCTHTFDTQRCTYRRGGRYANLCLTLL